MIDRELEVTNLLKKIQSSTTSDIDEERGSFKKGDTVTYNMLGGGLTSSDLIRMLGVTEHTLRATHDGTPAKIVEAIGEEVARYSIMFEDGFVINDVAVSELKSIKETSEDDLLAIANTKLGWAVAEQLKSILDNPSSHGIDGADLNPNAIKLIYRFLYRRHDDLSHHARAAIEDWVEDGYGDPDVLGGLEPRESREKVDEQKLSVDDVKKLFKSIDRAFAKHLTGLTTSKKDVIRRGQEVGLELSAEGKEVLGEAKTDEGGGYVCVRCGSKNPVEVEGKIKCLKCGHVEDITPGETLNIPVRKESKTNEAEESEPKKGSFYHKKDRVRRVTSVDDAGRVTYEVFFGHKEPEGYWFTTHGVQGTNTANAWKKWIEKSKTEEVKLEKIPGTGRYRIAESKTNEADDATDTMRPQEKPDINAEDANMEDYSEEDLNKPEAEIKSKSEKSGDAIRPVEDDELKIEPDKVVKPKKESKETIREEKCPKCGSDSFTEGNEAGDYMCAECGYDESVDESEVKEEETEFTPSRAQFKKIGDEKLKLLLKNARKSEAYWKKDGSAPEKVSAAADAIAKYEEEMTDRDLMGESKFSFMKKQKPLWLCNECFITYRSDEAACALCESENVEKILDEQSKEVFKVTWDTEDGKEESTTVMAFDKTSAEKEAERPSRKITKVEGPITKENKEGDKVPFDESSEGSSMIRFASKTTEWGSDALKDFDSVLKQQKIVPLARSPRPLENEMSAYLVKAKDKDKFQKLSNQYNVGFEVAEVEESKVDEQQSVIDAQIDLGMNLLHDKYDYDVSKVMDHLMSASSKLNPDEWKEVEQELRKYVDSLEESNEQEEDWDLSFMYRHNLIWHNPLVDHKGNPFIWQKQATALAGKKVRVFSDYQANWVETNKGTAVKVDYEPMPEKKEQPEFTNVVEIVRSSIDPDAFNIRVVELPKGSIVILDTRSDKGEAKKRGKELARVLNAKFAGIIDEKKVDESMPYEEALKIAKQPEDYMEDQISSAYQAISNVELTDENREEIRKALSNLGYVKKESKLKEQEEDTFEIAAKGIGDKETANKIASEEDGQVVADEEDENKFAVIVKKET